MKTRNTFVQLFIFCFNRNEFLKNYRFAVKLGRKVSMVTRLLSVEGKGTKQTLTSLYLKLNPKVIHHFVLWMSVL